MEVFPLPCGPCTKAMVAGLVKRWSDVIGKRRTWHIREVRFDGGFSVFALFPDLFGFGGGDFCACNSKGT